MSHTKFILIPELIRLLISKDENKKESARAVLYHELGHALSYEGIGEDSIFNNALSCLEESLSFDMYDQSPENQKSLGEEVISDWISSQAFAQRIRSGRFTTSQLKSKLYLCFRESFVIPWIIHDGKKRNLFRRRFK